MTVVLAGRDLAKSYGGVRALAGVDVAFREGTVHALVGENGAGKSTLVRILAGAVPPDRGELLLGGRPARFGSTAEAARQRVAIVSQELNLFPDQDVLANVFAHRLPRRGPLVDRAAMRALAAPVLAELGLRAPPDALVESLPLGERQLVEIARALVERPRVLILDEPTSALQPAEVARLHEIIGGLRDRGTAVVYVSHVLEDVLAICDEVTVLRDGAVVLGGAEAAGLDLATLVTAMLGGRAPKAGHPTRRPAGAESAAEADGAAGPMGMAGVAGEMGMAGATGMAGEVGAAGAGRLRLVSVTVPGRLREVSLEAAPGEILGIAGLVGSGHIDVLRVVAGALAPASGRVDLPGGARPAPGVRGAVRAGVGLISGDRRGVGITADKPVWENVVQVDAVALARHGGWLTARALREAARVFTERVGVRMSSIEQAVDQLSGGNQQKVVFAKWLAARPSVLLMDDPTRGIDIGARAEIYALMAELAQAGAVQLLASSDPKELAEVCHRVVVIRKGRVSAVLEGAGLTAHAVLEAVNGDREP
ncbi:sugar ABC transporter ATP-binding protein [Nonomuraea sp. NPDC050153]|uniref:sugar ABC transporter ATP-binding protein n=1 Tax=Nonomuraea sp. NPDC050153 TaxID=3364359 RepID=UPI003796AF29